MWFERVDVPGRANLLRQEQGIDSEMGSTVDNDVARSHAADGTGQLSTLEGVPGHRAADPTVGREAGELEPGREPDGQRAAGSAGHAAIL